ncbi:MAG: hypothetical protein IPM48_06540 [Saprospiraceae bacterium]|nr:hypothetical protein [Saprospiraceae bacterium]
MEAHLLQIIRSTIFKAALARLVEMMGELYGRLIFDPDKSSGQLDLIYLPLGFIVGIYDSTDHFRSRRLWFVRTVFSEEKTNQNRSWKGIFQSIGIHRLRGN